MYDCTYSDSKRRTFFAPNFRTRTAVALSMEMRARAENQRLGIMLLTTLLSYYTSASHAAPIKTFAVEIEPENAFGSFHDLGSNSTHSQTFATIIRADLLNGKMLVEISSLSKKMRTICQMPPGENDICSCIECESVILKCTKPNRTKRATADSLRMNPPTQTNTNKKPALTIRTPTTAEAGLLHGNSPTPSVNTNTGNSTRESEISSVPTSPTTPSPTEDPTNTHPLDPTLMPPEFKQKVEESWESYYIIASVSAAVLIGALVVLLVWYFNVVKCLRCRHDNPAHESEIDLQKTTKHHGATNDSISLHSSSVQV